MGTGSIAVAAREELAHQHMTAEGLMRRCRGVAPNSFGFDVSAEGVHRLGSGKLLARPGARIRLGCSSVFQCTGHTQDATPTKPKK